MTQNFLLPLVSKEEIAANTMAFTFSLEGVEYAFAPGQYAYFTIPSLPPDAENNKIFSFAHASNGKTLTIIMRMRPSPFKYALAAMQVGDKVQVSPALGFFALHDDHTQPAVFLAGGVGIAPFCSLIESAIKQDLNLPIYLYYSNRYYPDIAYMEKIASYQEQYPHLFASLIFTHEEEDEVHFGRLSASAIGAELVHPQDAIYYISGSSAFVDDLSSQLQAMGVPPSHIKLEAFTGYETPLTNNALRA